MQSRRPRPVSVYGTDSRNGGLVLGGLGARQEGIGQLDDGLPDNGDRPGRSTDRSPPF